MYRQVRIVLVRHFIDMGRLTISPGGTSVRLHGSLCRMPGVEAPLTPDVVGVILGEIGRVPGVRRVDVDFDNWQPTDGAGEWRPVAPAPIKKSSGPATADSQTFDLGKTPPPAASQPS